MENEITAHKAGVVVELGAAVGAGRLDRRHARGDRLGVSSLRALAVHPDVIVVVSGVWQTTCTAVRSGDEGFLIDSPVLPEELDTLPAVLEQAGFPMSGLLANMAIGTTCSASWRSLTALSESVRRPPPA